MTAFELGLPYYLRACRQHRTCTDGADHEERSKPGAAQGHRDIPEPSLLGGVVWLLWVLNSPPGVV